MAVIGYIRVSTDDQNPNLQQDALKAAGCNRIFEDFDYSAVSQTRPGFEAALASLQPGDTFIIWNMDRAFRSIRQALETMDFLRARHVSFFSVTENVIDTTTASGRLNYNIRNVFAQYERELISERTKAGLEAARRRGVVLGRPRKLTSKQIERARRTLKRKPQTSVSHLARKLRVSPQTLSRALTRPRPKEIISIDAQVIVSEGSVRRWQPPNPRK